MAIPPSFNILVEQIDREINNLDTELCDFTHKLAAALWNHKSTKRQTYG